MVNTIAAVSAVSGAAAALSARAVFRLSAPRIDPPVGGCPGCGRPFSAGIRGWLPGHRRCPGCARINGPPWWALAAPGALVSGLLAARFTPATTAEWALLVAWLIFAQAGICLSAVDIAVHRLPTHVVSGTAGGIAAAISAATLLERNSEVFVHAGLGTLTVGGVYLLLFILVPDGIGAGDVRLAAVTGLMLGSSGWRTVMLGLALPYLLCLPFAAVTVIRRRGQRSAQIPFGPFLVAGSLIAGIAER